MWQASGDEIVYHRHDGQLMAVGLAVANDTLQIGSSEPLFQIHPPRPDGANFSLSPDRERLVLWTNKQKQSDAVLNFIVNWPAELARKESR